MAVVEDATTASEAAARSDRRLVMLLGLLVAVVVLPVLAWWGWTKYVAVGLDVTWADEPTCTGTKLAGDGHAIVTDPAMSCVISVTVTNTSPVSVTVDHAVLPLLGPGGGAVIDTVGDESQMYDVDATLPLGHELGSDESYTFDVRIEFRKDGCTSAGRMGVDGWPTVWVSYLGRDLQVSATEQLAIVSRRQNPGCPR